MKIKIISVIALFCILFSCGSSNTNVTDTWKKKQANGDEKIKSLFIAFLNPDKEDKVTLENELAYWANQKGVKPVKSYEVFEGVSKSNMPTREDALKKINDTGADAIFVMTMRTSDTDPNNEKDNSAAFIVPWSVSFYGYYSNVFPLVYDPSYYRSDKIYYMESRLFDAKTEELLWSAKSETYNPANFEGFVKSYMNTLFKQLEKDGIIKKTGNEPDYK